MSQLSSVSFSHHKYMSEKVIGLEAAEMQREKF